MWDYDYVSLTDEQKLLRRAQLDWAGYYVILSQLLVGVLVGLYRNTSGGSGGGRLRRLMWKLYDPISLRYPKLRCWRDWLVVAAWTGWCMSLVVVNTGNDYFHLTKSLGTVAAANLPLHFLLAMKRSPLRWLFGLSYEGQANFLHRWLGRIINLLLYTHAALYLDFFWRAGKMNTRFLEGDVLCGVGAVGVLFAIGLSANHTIRHRWYRTFYLLHITLAPLLFPLLYLHVSHLRPYLLCSIFLFTVDQALKYHLRIQALASITTPSPGLLLITGTLPSAPPTPPPPGSHCQLLHAQSSFWGANPFTILPSSSNSSGGGGKQIRLIARVRGGTTRRLAALALRTTANGRPVQVTIDMPFGPTTPRLDSFDDVDNVLFIAGGVGATFAVGWVVRLLQLSTTSNREGEWGRGKVRFIWAVKSPAEAAWALEYPGVAGCVELFITNPTGTAATSDVHGDEEGVEMTEGLLSSTAATAGDGAGDGTGDGTADGALDALVRLGLDRHRIERGRPNLAKMVGETVLRAGEGGGGSGGNGGSTAVMVCAPAAMAAVVKRAVARQGMHGRDVSIHVEEFGH